MNKHIHTIMGYTIGLLFSGVVFTALFITLPVGFFILACLTLFAATFAIVLFSSEPDPSDLVDVPAPIQPTQQPQKKTKPAVEMELV